jgi:hypothetical protein
MSIWLQLAFELAAATLIFMTVGGADMAEERYRYGLYLNPQNNDEWFSDLAIAESKARNMSIANLGTPVAVWDSNDRTIKLFAGYEIFVPAVN